MEYRVLVVCQRFWPENQKLVDICEGFVERGMQVDVLCGMPYEAGRQISAGTGVYKEPEGMRVFRCRESSPEDRGSLSIFANYVSFRLSSVAKIKELREIHYDRIFIYQVSPVTMCAAGLKLGKKEGIDVTLYAAELWPHVIMDELDVRSLIFKAFLELVARHYYKAADKIIVNSPNTKDYFVKELNIPSGRVRFIPQSAERIYEHTIPDDDLLERFAGSFKIVYIGEIGRRQRFSTVIEAADIAKKNGMKRLRFIIVGTGPNLLQMEKEINERGLREFFVFEGVKSELEIRKYLNMADALLDTRASNEAEDFYVPDKLASYMAAGRPMLMVMGGNAGNLIKEAECGFVSGPDEPETLYANIKKLYEMSRPDRKVLGANAAEYQREHFNRDKNLVMLMEEIHSTKRADKGNRFKKNAVKHAAGSRRKTEKDNWIDDEFK